MNGAQPQIEKNPPPLDSANIDTSVKPEDDFFRYANGSWLKKNPVPPEYSRWGSFNELIEKNNDALHEIAEKAADLQQRAAGQSNVDKTAALDVQKVGDFYASGMNESLINGVKLAALKGELRRIGLVEDL
ncbi:MAG TPA: M13 family metallopeptidase N-terminal domain-containing protein, partial [Candidatus Binatia bacterium]